MLALYAAHAGALLALTVGANCPGLAATNPGLQKLLFGAVGLPFGLFFVLVSNFRAQTFEQINFLRI
jgi:hypothetical protein